MSPAPRPWIAATVAAAALLAGGPALSAASGDAAERARIADERRAVEARFDAARRDCEARFVVTTCLADARQQRRDALEPLQRQLHLLDDARRRERAAERLQSIREREAAAAARPALAASSAAAPASAAQAPAPVRRAVRPAPSASEAAAEAQRRAAQQQQRVQQAQAHEQAVKERNARHDAQRKPAAGLPVPVLPAASAP